MNRESDVKINTFIRIKKKKKNHTTTNRLYCQTIFYFNFFNKKFIEAKLAWAVVHYLCIYDKDKKIGDGKWLSQDSHKKIGMLN